MFFWFPNLVGSYAEKVVVDENCVEPLPESLDFAQGACIPVAYFTAYRALVQMYLFHSRSSQEFLDIDTRMTLIAISLMQKPVHVHALYMYCTEVAQNLVKLY